MQPILVGVDLSECSRRALDLALLLARTMDAAVRIVHVIPSASLYPGWAPYPFFPEIVTTELEKQFEEFVRERLDAHELSSDRVQTQVRHGFEHQELLAAVEEHRPALLVVGSHGHSRLGRLFLGSVSSKLVRSAPVSVLVVHDAGRLPAWIVAGVALGSSTSLVLRTARRWQELLGARLDLVHVLDPPPTLGLHNSALIQEVVEHHDARQAELRSRLLRAVEDAFQDRPVPSVRFLDGRADVELCELAEQAGAELLVIGAHEKQGILDMGDTALRVVHSSPCSVLVVREAAEPSETAAA